MANYSVEVNLQTIRNELKSILKGYSSLNASDKKRLKKLGFRMEEGKTHTKVFFGSDTSFPCVIAKTCSDYRGGLNAVPVLMKLVVRQMDWVA